MSHKTELIEEYCLLPPRGGQAYFEQARLVAANWIYLSGWIQGPPRDRLNVACGVSRISVATMERPDVCRIFEVPPETAIGFGIHLIDQTPFGNELLKLSLLMGDGCVLKAALRPPANALPSVALATDASHRLLQDLSNARVPGELEVVLPPDLPDIVPYTKEQLRLLHQPGAIGLEVAAPPRDCVFDNLVSLSATQFPNTTGLWIEGRLPFPDECFDFVLLNKNDQIPFEEVTRVLRPGGLISNGRTSAFAAEHGYLVRGIGALPQKPGQSRIAWPGETLWPRLAELTPSAGLMNLVGAHKEADFRVVGRQFVDYFLEFCNLTPDSRVLDIGCGCGRMALELAGYLSPAGSYEGFDINPDLIAWCDANIANFSPNFRFWLMPRFSKLYNPDFKPDPVPKPGRWFHLFGSRSKAAGDEAVDGHSLFPYKSEDFDLISASSVFTHLLADDAAAYLNEVGRTLRPSGRCLLTFFLLNEKARQTVPARKPLFTFQHRKSPGCFVEVVDDPEYAVAYDERHIRDLFSSAGLRIIEPILFGNWSGQPGSLTMQDVVVAERA